MSISGMVCQMESLGRNCEFGYVQAACGVEPISLLRWAGGSITGLIDGLMNGWTGLMEGATGKISSVDEPPWRQKWWLTCLRYGITFHTDVPVSMTVPEAAAHVRKRLRWQAAKLMGDLQAGEKLFVYSSADPADLAHVGTLLAVMRDIGDAGLMFVSEGTGGAYAAGDGLIMATLPRLTQRGAAAGADIESWKALVPVAHGLWGRGAPPGRVFACRCAA